MSTRTLGEMVASVARGLGGAASRVPIGDIQQAIFNTNLHVHSRYPWPWTLAETNIAIQAVYTTGTISITTGSATVTGSGTAWGTAWKNKRIMFGSSNADYLVSSVNSTTSITLAQTANLSASLSGEDYTIFQDVYSLPADYEQGSDIALINQSLRLQIRKIPTVTLQQQRATLKSCFSNFVVSYADFGYDSTAARYRIIVTPPPSSVDEYKFIYRRCPPNLMLAGDLSLLPESYVEYLELSALARVKQMHKIPGWVDDERQAVQVLRAMRRAIATQNIVNNATGHGYPLSNSSFSEGGVSIRPGWVA